MKFESKYVQNLKNVSPLPRHLCYDTTRGCPSLKQWSKVRSRKMCKIEDGTSILSHPERMRAPRIIIVLLAERAAIQREEAWPKREGSSPCLLQLDHLFNLKKLPEDVLHPNKKSILRKRKTWFPGNREANLGESQREFQVPKQRPGWHWAASLNRNLPGEGGMFKKKFFLTKYEVLWNTGLRYYWK